MRKGPGRVMGIAISASLTLLAARAPAGSLNPTNAPGPTMHTLEEMNQKVEVFAPPRTLSATTTVVQTGYYAQTNLTQVDPDLTAANIKTNVIVFGITGTHVGGGIIYTNSHVALAKTGQLAVYQSGDDGTYQKGYPWPNPRFATGTGIASNCVTDNSTGLMWLRNPKTNLYEWADALAYCESLNGNDGRGNYTDWRLPNALEQGSLFSYSGNPSFPAVHPFDATAASSTYWTSTTAKWSAYLAWVADANSGALNALDKTTNYCAWPVRGGQ